MSRKRNLKRRVLKQNPSYSVMSMFPVKGDKTARKAAAVTAPVKSRS